MSENPKPPPLDQWLVFELRCGTGPYWAVYWNTTDENSAHLHLPEGWDGRPRKMLHVSETDAAELADARTYRDAVRAAHNGYYAEMRDAMPELREPESPAAAISDLVQTAEEDGAMQERLRWEPELAALRAERDRLLNENDWLRTENRRLNLIGEWIGNAELDRIQKGELRAERDRLLELLADALQWSEQYQIAPTWSARVRKEIAK